MSTVLLGLALAVAPAEAAAQPLRWFPPGGDGGRRGLRRREQRYLDRADAER
jgi:hypothetical protein